MKSSILGKSIYASWIVLTVAIQVLLLLLCLAFFGVENGAHLWLVNGLFRLNICTSRMMKDGGHGVQWCSSEFGPTSGTEAKI